MPIVAPWLQPPNVLGAMQSGASLGLQLRAQNIAQQEAAARREQEAAELEARKQTAADTLRVQRETGAARLALAASNAAALAGDRQAQRRIGEAGLALRRRAEERFDRKQKFDEEEAAKKAAGIKPTPIVITHPTTGAEMGVFLPTGPNSGQVLGQPPKAGSTALEKGLSGMHQAEMREAAKLRLQEQLETPPDTNRVNAANQLINSASNQLFRLSPQSLPGSTNTVPAVKRFRVRDKKTGKLGWWEGSEVPAEYELISE